MTVTDKHAAFLRAYKNTHNKLIRTEVLATIDDLNQYLNGNVTKTGLQITLSELINKL